MVQSFHSLILIGLDFWKVGSRKVYAIQRDAKRKSRKQARHISYSDSDSEAADFLPRKKSASAAEVNSVKNEVMVMDQMQRIFQIDRRMKIPVGSVNIVAN